MTGPRDSHGTSGIRSAGGAPSGSRPGGGERQRGAWGRAFDLLASGRLAVWLLVAVVALLLCYLFLPQVSRLGPGPVARWVEERGLVGAMIHGIGLTDLRGSWALLGTFSLLFVNLLSCMIRRARAAATLWQMPRRPPAPSRDWLRREVGGFRPSVAELEGALRRRGYRTRIEAGAVYGLRGRFAVAGHWLFHVGMLVLLVGGAYVMARPAPFRGTIGLGEGESFDLREAAFLGTNRPIPPELPDLEFGVEAIAFATEGGEARRFDVVLSTIEAEKISVGINRPYRAPPYQVLAHGFGYMPGWAIVDGRGRMLRGAWVKLVPFPLQAEESFPLGPPLSSVQVSFLPDHGQEESGEVSRSYELNRPRFRTRIDFRGETIHEGLLAPGQRVTIEGDREFFFLPEIRRYALFDVIEERGHGVFFAAFAVMIVGLFVRYGRIRKEILVRVEDGSLFIHGRAEILENLFSEELDRLVSDLKDRRPAPAATREFA